MDDKKITREEEAFEGSGIFIAEYDMGGTMEMERIIVSAPAILETLKVTKISLEEQEKAVNDLVDRTPDWLEFDEADQIERIKATLTQETVLWYLYEKGIIKKKCDFVEVGVDVEGSIIVYAYYTHTNRETRRAAMKMDKAQQEKIEQAVNFLGVNGNLVDMAREKMERIKKEGGKVVPFKPRK